MHVEQTGTVQQEMTNVDTFSDEHATKEEEETGLEREREDPSDKIDHPFDPEKIRIQTAPLLVGQLISRIDHEEIDLAPDFQRMAGIWRPADKSRLIESLLLRIPIPLFYVAADESDTWSVVDGLQRMTTMYDFAKDKFRLRQLEYLTQLNGLLYSSLPRRFQRRIDETPLIVNVVESGTPPEVMFNVFLRINTGGTPLNRQEIRHALNPGPARNYLRDLAQSEEFIAATGGSIKSERMSDRECVLRFLSFYLTPWHSYSSSDLDGFLGVGMNKINKMSDPERDLIADTFKRSMVAATNIFGKTAFRKSAGASDRWRPVNRALFETWSVVLALRTPSEMASLVGKRDTIQKRFKDLLELDNEYDNAISYSTGSPSRVHKRFAAIEGLVEEIVK